MQNAYFFNEMNCEKKQRNGMVIRALCITLKDVLFYCFVGKHYFQQISLAVEVEDGGEE